MRSHQSRRVSQRNGGRLNVLIVTESYLPSVNGVTNSVVRVSDHLLQLGHNVRIVAPAVPPNHGEGTIDERGIRIDRVPSVHLRKAGFQLGVATAAKLRPIFEDFQPDVVHLASPILLCASALKVARELDVPTVGVFQTDVPAFVRDHNIPATFPIDRWVRYLHRRCDVNLVPSRASLRYLNSLNVPNLKIWGRGVDAKLFHPAKRSDTLRRELAPNGEILVGYMGRLSSEKKIELLADVQHLAGVKLVVIGDGYARAQLEAVLPKAIFTGQLEGERLATMLASLDVFTHTGPNETFCQAVQEAMASGVVAVAPMSGGPLDLIEPGVNGLFFEPNSMSSLTRTVQHLVDNPGFRTHAGTVAREFAETRTWDAHVTQLMSTYTKAIGMNRGAAAYSFADIA